MFSLCSRARATVTTALLLGLSVSPAAQAADMLPMLPAAPAPIDEPTEWSSGWYLRGDLEAQQLTTPSVTSDFAGQLGKNGNIGGGIGVGYQFNNWLRADVTLDRSVFRPGQALPSIWCPYSLVRLVDPNTTKDVGIFANPNETCTPYESAHLDRTSLMFNGYVDLGNWYGLTPYVGAGIGATYMQNSASLNYYKNSNGQLWAPDLTLPNGAVPLWIDVNGNPWPMQLAFGPTNWNRGIQRKTVKFAWNLMAGVSYDISQNLKIDVGYRFLNAGTYTTLPSFSSGKTAQEQSLTSHEIRVGLRLLAN